MFPDNHNRGKHAHLIQKQAFRWHSFNVDTDAIMHNVIGMFLLAEVQICSSFGGGVRLMIQRTSCISSDVNPNVALTQSK